VEWETNTNVYRLEYITSHNIYLSELGKRSKRLYKSNQPKRIVRFNKLGCLTISLKNLKSFYKDESGTYIEVAGVNQPIAVLKHIYKDEQLFEYSPFINRNKF
jgi:hypothetical protein